MIIVPLALLGIFFLLLSVFGNIRDASIVLINVPFAAIGGIVALHLAGETLSISALFGFLSLFGIAVLDGVILISFINKVSSEDESQMKDAMVEGASLIARNWIGGSTTLSISYCRRYDHRNDSDPVCLTGLLCMVTVS
jgi:cobalt-zinc-cadmium resistance protein CzcA